MQRGINWIFAERDQCKLVILRLSLAGNLVKPLMSEWRERGYNGLGRSQMQRGKNWIFAERDQCKLVLLRLSLAGDLENHLCPCMGPNM